MQVVEKMPSEQKRKRAPIYCPFSTAYEECCPCLEHRCAWWNADKGECWVLTVLRALFEYIKHRFINESVWGR